MRSLRSFSLAFILFGLSFFAIAPSRALAADYVPYDSDELMYFVVPQSVADAEGYSDNSYNNVRSVQTYHYSHTDLIDTDSVVSADYVIEQQHTGMFGGWLQVPSVNTTASGTIQTAYGHRNGLFWNPNYYMQAYKRSGETQWGYKPAQVSSSDDYDYNKIYLYLNSTSNMTASGYNVDMSHATSSVNVTGTQTKDETGTTEGTLTHQEFTTYDYKWLPFTSSEPVYLYIGVVSASGAWAGNTGQTFYFSVNRYRYQYDSVTGRQGEFGNVRMCNKRSNQPWVVQNVSDNKGLMTLSYACNFVGVRIPINGNVNQGLLIPMPEIFRVDYSVEQNNTTETNKQTAELKDTTGSNTTVTNAQGVFDNTIKSKLGFVAQTADITTGLFDALTYEGEGTVPFPALQWQGQTIIAAQNVPILGYIPDIEDDVKTGVTLVLFLAWLHGIHSLYARMFLGETMVEVDEE